MAKRKGDTFTFDLAGLHQFDDDVTKDFNAQLQGIVADCRKRASCNKHRTVNLKIEAVPSENDPDDVVLTCVVSSKIPAAKHIARRARANSFNQLRLELDHSDDIGGDDDE